MTENHSIRQRTFIIYSSEYQTELNLDKNKFLDWNETSFQTRKKHPTQLVRILHTLVDLLSNTSKLEEYSLKETLFVQKIADIQISKEDKKQTTKKYLNLVKRILSRNRNSQHTLIYTDEFKILVNIDTDLVYMSEKNIDENFWNLETTLDVFDTELFAIYQVLKWMQSFDLEKTREIWIFSDSQAEIQRLLNIKSESEYHLTVKCHSLLHILKSQDFTTHIHWISSHRDIIDNKKADIVVHKDAEQKVKLHSERFISISYIKALIKAKVLISWKNHWNLVKKECTYTHMKIKSHWNQNKHLKNINRLQFFTFTQMKLDHDYFKFYLNRLSDYDSDKCHWLCQQRQTSEHLLTVIILDMSS